MKKIKWLEYFKDWFDVGSYSFLEQLDVQLKPEFERRIGKNLDWNKLWLYIEPSTEVLFLEESDRLKFTRLICSLAYGHAYINCEITWSSPAGDMHLDPKNAKLNERVDFSILRFDDNLEFAERFPGLGQTTYHKKLEVLASFPVILLDGVISPEGNLLISLKDHSKVEEVKRIFTQVQALWNDDNFIIDTFPSYRGKLHQIHFTEWTEEGQAEFYYDTGSAIDGVHEYLISSLKEIEDDILKVELEAI